MKYLIAFFFLIKLSIAGRFEPAALFGLFAQTKIKNKIDKFFFASRVIPSRVDTIRQYLCSWLHDFVVPSFTI